MGTHPIFESDFDCLTEIIMLRLASQLLPKRSFSKYMADTYGVKQHRLAKKAGIEVEPVEVVAYFMGAAILISDIMRDQHHHRQCYEAAGSPDEVWNQSLYIQPETFSVQTHTMVSLRGGV